MRALVVAAVAAAFAFWTLGLAVYFTVELLARVVPRWAAVGIVLALFLIVTVAMLLVVRARLAAIEPPAATVRRRLEDSPALVADAHRPARGRRGGGRRARGGAMTDERVERSRQHFETTLEDLRSAVEQELGWAPRLSRWAVPLAAAAAGVALGVVVRRALPRRRRLRR